LFSCRSPVEFLARPAAVKVIFNDSCQTIYLQIYWTDLRQIFRIGRTMAVDNQSEISISIPQGILLCYGNQFLSLDAGG